jgi:hypothetical protein
VLKTMKTIAIILLAGAAAAFGSDIETRATIENTAKIKFEWRVMNGYTNHTHTAGWAVFKGVVEQHHRDGIRVRGSYYVRGSEIRHNGDFIVVNFPYEVADGDTIGYGPETFLLAWPSGLYEYTSVLGGPRTLRKLDWGKPIQVPARKPAVAMKKETPAK